MSMRVFGLILLLASVAAEAAPLPPVDARLLHESTLITSGGVTEQRHFRERLLRRDGVVWRERILPAAVAGHAKPHTHVGLREHFDYESATFWLDGRTGPKAELRFVDARERRVVAVPAAEYETVGFDGSYEAAAALVEPQRVARMPVSPRPSPVKNAVWHEEARNGVYSRVLWSTALQIALIVEAGREDGTQQRRTSVELLPATPEAELPWRALSGYQQMSYDDFMD